MPSSTTIRAAAFIRKGAGIPAALGLLATLPFASCAQVDVPIDEAQAQFRIIDCLLPPQMIVQGQGIVHFSPSRAAKLTVKACADQGGARKAGIDLWRQFAEGGNVDAQVYLGEMYENGTGGAKKDATQAIVWYEKAARAGSARAKSDLAMLYSSGGEGVAPDPAKARELMAQAAGVELRSLKVEPVNAPQSPAHESRPARSGDVDFKNFPFGNYYALLIGNGDYQRAPKLTSPPHEVDVIGKLLTSKYGFQVQVLKNATWMQVTRALDDVIVKLKPEDNLLLYDSSHGAQDETKEGYWIPIDGEPPTSTGAERTRLWVSSADVRNHLERAKAGHILVISDSCYAGRFLEFKGTLDANDGDSMAEFRQNFIKVYGAKTRVVLTSGGLTPVIDGTNAVNLSVFAQHFIAYLQGSQTPFPSSQLYSGIQLDVLKETGALGNPQQPQWGPMGMAGHESGDFWFAPR